MSNNNDDFDDEISDCRLKEIEAERKEIHERYAYFCPDSDVEAFVASAMAIVVFDSPNAPNQEINLNKKGKNTNQGFAKSINAELSTLRTAVSKLSPATRGFIIDREVSQFREAMVATDKNQKMSSEMSRLKYGGSSCLERLERIIQDDYRGKRVDTLREYIARQTASLWLRHGGSITRSTSKNENFIALLERIIEDRQQIIEEYNILMNRAFKNQKHQIAFQNVVKLYSSGNMKKVERLKKIKYDATRMIKDYNLQDQTG
jgi:hypothetical protein